MLDDLCDQEDKKMVVLPPENKSDVTDEENDDENLMETRVVEKVPGENEVFHKSLESDH